MDSTATDLFNLLVSRDYTVKTLDIQGKPVVSPGDAQMFSFDFETKNNNYGTVVILLDDESNFECYYGDNVGKNMEGDDKDAWYDFLAQLKNFATRNLLTFSLKNLNKLKYSMQGLAAINEGLFEGWNGTKHTSYNNKPGTTRLKIVHSKAIEEGEQRFRNIEKLYVENAEGERFKLPFTSLVAGRVMARHVAEGGTPYDVFGQHITDIVREANVLAKFTQATRTITEDDAEQFGVVEAGRDRYKTLRHRLKALAGKRGYHAYKEEWNPAEIEEGISAIDDLQRIFTRETIDPRIEEAFPYLTAATQGPDMNESSLWDLNQKFLKKGQKTRAAIEKFFGDHGYPVHTSSTGAGLRTHNGAVFVLQNWPSQGNVLSYLQHNSRPGSPDRKDIINIMKNYGNVMSQPGNESVYGIAFKNGTQALEILQAVDALSESKESQMKELNEFSQWAEQVTEGTWAIPDDEAKIKQLKDILAKPLPVGTDAMNATGVLYDIIGDDELFDSLAALAEDDPEADARPVIEHWLELYTDSYPGLEDLADRVLGRSENDELDFEESADFGAQGMNKYGLSAVKGPDGFYALVNGKIVAGPFDSLEELKAYQEGELNKESVEEQLDIDTGEQQRKVERDAMLEMNSWRKLAGMQEKVYEDFTAFQEPQQQVEEGFKDTPLRDREDYLEKNKALYNMMINPEFQDEETQQLIQDRINRLNDEARKMGLIEMTEEEYASKLNDDILDELNASDLGKEGVDWFAPGDTEPYDPERDDPRDDPSYGYDRPTDQTKDQTQEGNAFSGALAKAKATGAGEFEVDGKRYRVEEVYAGKFGAANNNDQDVEQIVPGESNTQSEKIEEAPGDEQLPPGYSRVGPRGVLVGPSGNLSNWRDPNMDPDYWARDNMTKYDMDADNEWDELENWLTSGSYKAGNDLRRSMMLKKYGLDQGVTPEKLAVARAKADAIKKAAQDKEDKFYQDMEVARILGRDAGSTADRERSRAETEKELASIRKNAGLATSINAPSLTKSLNKDGSKGSVDVGQGWSDQMDIDDLDRVSAKYGTSPASDQTAALAHQEREFAPGSDEAWDQYVAKHGDGKSKVPTTRKMGMDVMDLGLKGESKEAEQKKVSEAGKPDYLDLDKDGNKKEPMKKAAADKEKDIDEGMVSDLDSTIAAKLAKLKKTGKITSDEWMQLNKMRTTNPKRALEIITNMLKQDSNELDERSLTKGEEKKREKYVKGMKKSKEDFKKRYGKRGEEVMYATATKMAKEGEGETSGGTNVYGKGIYESLLELENDLDTELGHGITATSQLDEPKNPVGMLEPTDVPVGIPTDMDVEIVSAEPKEKNLGDKIADKGAELSAQIDAALADIKRLAGMGM